jgi:RimJ/RimL family protein N-acetyltransferase
MSAPVTIRRAEPGDADELVALAQSVAAEPEGWLLTRGEWRPASEERRYLKAIRRLDDAAVFVAESASAGLVGRLSIARDPHPASPHVADVGLLVASAHRGRGIGGALLDAAVAWARRVGITKLELHVFPHNTPAIHLYERFGFVQEGYRRAQYRRGSEVLDAVLMAYLVPPRE